MEFPTVIFIVFSVVFVEIPEYVYSMDLNSPPAREPPYNTTTTDHTDLSRLYNLEMELIATKNRMHSLMNDVKSHRMKGGTFAQAKRRIDELRQDAEYKERTIREMKISIGISPDQGGQERTQGSSSSATSSSHSGPSTVDILKDKLQEIDSKIQQIRDDAMRKKFKGRAVLKAQREMTSLQEKRMKKQKALIEEDLRLQLDRNVEPEEVERAYAEQERNQRELELQQHLTEIGTQPESKSYKKPEEYTSSMDLNHPPAGEPPFNATISDQTDSSKLYDLEMELIATENRMHSLMNNVKIHKLRGGAFKVVKKQIEELGLDAERKKKAISEIKMGKGIHPGLPVNVRAEGSGSSAASSSHRASSTVDTLKDELGRIRNEIKYLRNGVQSKNLSGAAARNAMSRMPYLEEQEIIKRKELIAEEFRIHFGTNAESENIERVFNEQENYRKRLELQQRRTEIIFKLEQISHENVPRGSTMKKLHDELEFIEKKLRE